MANSTDIIGLSLHDKALCIHSMLHSPVRVRDIFKFALSGACFDGKEVMNMSEEAWKIWNADPKGRKKLRNGFAEVQHVKGTTIEHVVPTNVLYRWLVANKDSLSINDIEDALLNCPVAIVSNAEAKMLVDAGLNHKMPVEDYDVLAGDPWSRYELVGLKAKMKWIEDSKGKK